MVEKNLIFDTIIFFLSFSALTFGTLKSAVGLDPGTVEGSFLCALNSPHLLPIVLVFFISPVKLPF